MKHTASYGIAFTISLLLSGVGSYLLTPARKAKTPSKEIPSNANTSISKDDIDDGDDEIFIPHVETPVDRLINNILTMKSLNATGSIDISVGGYSVAISNVNAYLTLDSFTDIEATLSADVSFMGMSTSIDVSYVEGSIFCSLFENNIKMKTSDISDVIDVFKEPGKSSTTTPSMFDDISLDSILEDMNSMEYGEINGKEDEHEFRVNLFGLDIYLTSNTQEGREDVLSSVKISGEIMGVSLDLSLETQLHSTIAEEIKSPETSEKVYREFSEYLPVLRMAKNLINTKSVSLNGDVSLNISGYDVSLRNINAYVTLDSLDNVAATLSTDIVFDNVNVPLSVTFVDGTLYVALLNNKIKTTTNDFSELFNIISSFGIPMDVPSSFENISIQSLVGSVLAMTIDNTNNEDGENDFLLNLLGINVELVSKTKNGVKDLLSGVKVSGELEGIGFDVDLSIDIEERVSKEVTSPEVGNNYQNLTGFFPFIRTAKNLASTKSLRLYGDINVAVSDYKVSLANIAAYITLESLDEINASLTADIVYNGKSTTLSVSYVGGSIYCSLLGNDIKMQTSDFTDLVDILKSLGIPMDLPTTVNTISISSALDEINQILASEESEGVSKLTTTLLGFDISVFSGIRNNVDTITEIDVAGEIEGINLDVKLQTELFTEVIAKINAPTNADEYQEFNAFFPFIEDIGRLANETRFGIKLDAKVVDLGKTDGMEIGGNLQFNLNDMSGEGKLSIVDKGDKTYVTNEKEIYPTHNIEINVDSEDMKFKYNEGMYGKFTLSNLSGLIEVITGFIGSDNPIMLLIQDRVVMPDLSDSTISRLANGEYELLFNDYITKLRADDTMLDIAISKDLLGIESDLELILKIDENRHLTGIELPKTIISGMEIEFRADFIDYDENYAKLPAESEAKYFDFSEIKYLLSIGLNTAEISRFHLKGKIGMDMSVIGFDLSNLAKIDMSFDMDIFNDMSDLSTRVIGTLDNVPSINILFGLVSNKESSLDSSYREDHKRLELAYDNEYIFMTRYSVGKKGGFLGIGATAYDKEVASTKILATDMLKDNNIIKYLLGFGFNLYGTSIYNTIIDAMTKTDPRTEPLDYSKIFNDYVYKSDSPVKRFDNVTATYAREWLVDVNIGELANNPDLESLSADIFGGSVDGLEGEYLQYIKAAFKVNAGGIFKCAINVDGELVDIDPSFTPALFTTSAAYNHLFDYLEAHKDAQPLD